MKLTFLGAARNVTGSCTLIETNDRRILIDCGYFPERKFKDRNWNDLYDCWEWIVYRWTN